MEELTSGWARNTRCVFRKSFDPEVALGESIEAFVRGRASLYTYVLHNFLLYPLFWGISKDFLHVLQSVRLLTYEKKFMNSPLNILNKTQQPSLSETSQPMLSERETEVLSWVAHGKMNREIGTILNISPRTVSKHLEHIFSKLGVETRTAAVVHFFEMGHQHSLDETPSSINGVPQKSVPQSPSR